YQTNGGWLVLTLVGQSSIVLKECPHGEKKNSQKVLVSSVTAVTADVKAPAEKISETNKRETLGHAAEGAVENVLEEMKQENK
ncbi:MAG: hypothetical protein J6I64_05370, partial [Lachnospiraceae bacterium]|nr:hypothetical protein [Lachnospiraceae bacterium]